MPTSWIVRGSLSQRFSAETARRMLELIPDSSALTIEDAGHNVMLDQPERLAGALQRFLR